MKLKLKEQERLIMFNVAEVSRRRWKRGIKLNYIEAMSIICDEVLERAREGKSTISDLIEVLSLIHISHRKRLRPKDRSKMQHWSDC